jgi:hypothetical protein
MCIMMLHADAGSKEKILSKEKVRQLTRRALDDLQQTFYPFTLFTLEDSRSPGHNLKLASYSPPKNARDNSEYPPPIGSGRHAIKDFRSGKGACR